jgi:hypothetical protein
LHIIVKAKLAVEGEASRRPKIICKDGGCVLLASSPNAGMGVHVILPHHRYIFLAVGLFLTTCIIYVYKTDNENFIPEYFLFPSIGLPGILLIFQYRQLRKRRLFIFWLALSLLPAYYSFQFQSDTSLILKSGHNAALSLKAPFLFLINYLLFNEISKRLYSTQLTLPPRSSFYDTEDERNTNIIDYLAFFSGLIILATSGMY